MTPTCGGSRSLTRIAHSPPAHTLLSLCCCFCCWCWCSSASTSTTTTIVLYDIHPGAAPAFLLWPTPTPTPTGESGVRYWLLAITGWQGKVGLISSRQPKAKSQPWKSKSAELCSKLCPSLLLTHSPFLALVLAFPRPPFLLSLSPSLPLVLSSRSLSTGRV
ncbi:hypothetical protein F4777DRAFT_329681 [Nemania sp. FL0916]|nr:hypothetical protein F4777DRAFT_329681 [Nemania sp. FL0916]